MKKIIKKIILNKITARLVIKPILVLNSLSYRFAGRFSMIIEDGIHPKHRLIGHKEWFLEQIEPGWVILDIGSNLGLMSEFLADKAGFVYGIEIKNELIKDAESKRKKSNIEYICADATKFDFNHCKQIDCVILSAVLEHIEDRVVFLKNLINNLNWKSLYHKLFLIRVPMITRDWITLYKKELGLDYRLDKTHFIEYTFEEFKKELQMAGIKILDYAIRFGEIYAVSRAL